MIGMSESYYSMFDKIKLSDGKRQEILKLSKTSKKFHKRYSIQKKYTIPAVCMLVLCFFILEPTKLYANKLLYELLGLIQVNRDSVEIGHSEWLKIDMPRDVESVKYDGVVYQYKTYDKLRSLEQDLGIELLDFACEYQVKDNSINFVVENHEAGSINMLIEHNKEGTPVSYTLYFSVAENVSTGQLKFEDMKRTYLSYKREGEDIKFDFEQKYDIVEIYKSENLNTDVIIAKENKNKIREDYQVSSETYFAIFVYNNIEYQLHFDTGVKDITRIIEQMK